MARLAHATYRSQRNYLRETWTSNQRVFALLTPKEQWDMHNFYLVTQEMTNAELRLHRQVVKRVDPSLPHRAGRTYAKLGRGDWKRIDHAVTPKGRAITIRSVVRPQPDFKRLTRTLIVNAIERQKNDTNEKP